MQLCKKKLRSAKHLMYNEKKKQEVNIMSELQKQAMEIIGEMSEDNLMVLVNFMQIFIQPHNATLSASPSAGKLPKRIGIAEGEELYDPDYDIDEYNDEIAKMFGVG